MLTQRTSEYHIGLPIAVLLAGSLPSAYGLKALHGCCHVNRRVKAQGVVPVFPVSPALLFSSGPDMKAQTPHNNRNITPVKAQKILLENNVEVSEKEAEKILDFLYFLAKLIVDQNFKK